MGVLGETGEGVARAKEGLGVEGKHASSKSAGELCLFAGHFWSLQRRASGAGGGAAVLLLAMLVWVITTRLVCCRCGRAVDVLMPSLEDSTKSAVCVRAHARDRTSHILLG